VQVVGISISGRLARSSPIKSFEVKHRLFEYLIFEGQKLLYSIRHTCVQIGIMFCLFDQLPVFAGSQMQFEHATR